MDNIRMIAETFFTGVWQMMLQTDIPGTDISIAGLSLALLVIGLSIRIFSYLTGFHMGSYGAAADAAEKGRSTIQKLKRKSGE